MCRSKCYNTLRYVMHCCPAHTHTSFMCLVTVRLPVSSAGTDHCVTSTQSPACLATAAHISCLGCLSKFSHQDTTAAQLRCLSCMQVAEKLLAQPGLSGLQGPTISPIFSKMEDGSIGQSEYFDCTVCIPKKQLYPAVNGFRQVSHYDFRGVMVCYSVHY